ALVLDAAVLGDSSGDVPEFAGVPAFLGKADVERFMGSIIKEVRDLQTVELVFFVNARSASSFFEFFQIVTGIRHAPILKEYATLFKMAGCPASDIPVT
ncbi:MAG: hypothetical protein AAB867_01840, partial [Patescibacteria group bacterium]